MRMVVNSRMRIYLVILAVFVSAALGASGVDKRVYTFAVGDDDPPFNIAPQGDSNMGFAVDIIRRVCEKAGKKCAFVRHTNYDDLWNTETRTSVGLNNRYWDACSTYYKTQERALVYGFFGEFSSEQPTFLFSSAAGSINNYDASNHVTGFRRGYWTSPSCLKANGMDVKNVRFYDDWTSLLNDLKGGQIDVGFIDEATGMRAGGLSKISSQVKCAMSGNSMMVRKEDVPDFAWFDPVLKEVINSPYYKWACNIAKRAYGGDPYCLK